MAEETNVVNLTSNKYLRDLSDRLDDIERERELLGEQVKQLRSSAKEAGIEWDAFTLAHKMRQKKTAEQQRAWSATFESAATQLGLFEDPK